MGSELNITLADLDVQEQKLNVEIAEYEEEISALKTEHEYIRLKRKELFNAEIKKVVDK